MSALLALAADAPALATLVADIDHGDKAARYKAVSQAPLVGTKAIAPLAEVMAKDDHAAAKAACEAIRAIAHHAARPGSHGEAKQASSELARLVTSDHPKKVRREALSLLGYIGGADAVPAITAQLGDAEVQDDARMALERMPDAAAGNALAKARGNASGDFAAAIDQSLRHKRSTMKTVGTGA